MRARRSGLFLAGLCLSLFLLPLPATAGRTGDIADVRGLYQDPFFYIRGDARAPILPGGESPECGDSFEERFFSPWDAGRVSRAREDLEWIFGHFEARGGYGQNLRLLAPAWLEDLEARADIGACGRVALPAISVVPTSLRLLPTEEPFFLDPDEAGEGYPFDYLQNSGVHLGEPLFISHYSRDGEWAFVEAAYASGWVPVRDIALAGEAFRRTWRSLPRAVLVEDGQALSDREGRFLARASIGAILPVLDRGAKGLVLCVPVLSPSGEAVPVEALCPTPAASPFPLPFTQWNVTRVASGLMGQPYGWGGFLGKRDCSATVRDIFLPFGIWLPRNSAAQAKAGTFVSFEGMEASEKEEALLRDGVPFATLVAMRGHIMLYVGQRGGRALVLHNTWGLRTRENGVEGRFIIGKTVITTLTPGKGLPQLDRERGPLIERVTGMTLLSSGGTGGK